MKKLGIPVVLPAIAIAGLAFLWSCGGGGGGGGISPSIPYSGINTPAVITGENAEILAVGAFLMGQYAGQGGDVIYLSSEGSEPVSTEVFPVNILALTRTWEETATSYLDRELTVKAVPLASVAESIPGYCGGYADVNGSVNEYNGDFNLNVTYYDYSDDCVFTMSGRTNMKGRMSMDLTLLYMTVTYEALALQGGGQNLTLSGRWSMDNREYPSKQTLDMVTRDEGTGKTYWARDYELYFSYVSGTSDQELEGTGRYYDPDFGYVELTTQTPLRYHYDDDYPYQGVFKLTGENPTAALLEFISSAVYRVTCDEDGDGQYDDYDTGIVHWPGENNMPTAEAGPDQEIVVDCGISLNGSTASDADGDALEYFWQFTSVPPGSQAVLSGENTPSPSFTPDLVGDYVVELTVNDGIDNSPADSLTITVIEGDFCSIKHIETGSRPEAVAIGDVGGVGGIEVVVTTSTGGYPPDYDYSLLVFSRSGFGLVNPPTVYPAGDGTSLAIGDVNSDGRNDVVVTVENGMIGIFYQASSGLLNAMNTFSAGHTGTSYSRGVAVGDFNHDGLPDICYLVVVDDILTVDIFTQKGDGTLNPPVSYEAGYGSMTDVLDVGDVNGDSWADIVVSSGAGTYGFPPEDLSILYQNASGTMDSVVHIDVGALNERPDSLAVGDLDDNGRDDIALQFSYPASEMTVLYQDVSGDLATSVSISTPFVFGPSDTLPLRVADIDQDGRNDLIGVYQHDWVEGAYGYVGPTVAISFQQNDGSLGSFSTTSPSITGRPYNTYGLAIGDIDDDGNLDVVFTNPRLSSGEPGVPGITIFSMGKW